jgi:hypothetical protein
VPAEKYKSMKTVRLRSWDRLDDALERIRREHGVYRRELSNGKVFERPVMLLFRGQSDSRWSLDTTLERKNDREYGVAEYVQLVSRAVHEVESYTGAKWNVPDLPALIDEIKAKSDSFRVHLPIYNFLVYLRHHGYPSPLLDWTESPYIAAFFAYSTARSNPAVYCYIERPQFVKGGKGGDPMISVKGPFVSTHKRHFAQKAWYTVATKWDYRSERHVFCSHERVFERHDMRQDLLIKLVLPGSDRGKAMRKLSEYNINHFTLFQSEEALVKALESKHFDLDV